MATPAPPGLSFPAHHGEPPGAPQPGTRPRDGDRRTRKPADLWDRVKILLLLAGAWSFLVAAEAGENRLMPVAEAARRNLRGGPLLLVVLFVAEVLRQLHYALSEVSAGYHQSWRRFFGGTERLAGRLGDHDRYRLGRAARVGLGLALLSVVLGAATGTSPVTALVTLPTRVLSMLPLALQVAFYAFLAVIQFVAIFWFLSKGGVDVYHPDEVQTRFGDVWGQDRVLERVKENILFLERPEEIEAKGGYVPGGILLWGPPGTGKTLMAEAVAGETGKPYVFVDPGAFRAMFFGVDIMKVKALFRRLRRLAVRYGGVIVFFDEADALGNRGQLAQGGPPAGPGPVRAWRHGGDCNGTAHLSPAAQDLVHQALTSRGAEPPRRLRDGLVVGGYGGGALQTMLSELSGLKKPRGFVNRYLRKLLGMRPKPPPKYRILVMMATNMPEALDEALLRPGRIDRIYKVGYPSKAGRVRTYEGYLAKVRHELTPEQIDKLAVMTPYATGATMKDLVNEALITAFRDGREVITWADVVRAKHLKELGPSEDAEYIERERHSIAIHEACHAVAAYRTRHHMRIDVATIEMGGDYLGMVSSIKPEDQFTMWRSEMEADIVVSLASLAGERMFFDGDNTSGVSGDLVSATALASSMEAYWGMGQTLAAHKVITEMQIGGGGRARRGDPLGEEGAGSLGHRIEDKLQAIYERAWSLLADNRAQVLALAHALETGKTLSGEDVEAVIDGREGPLVDGRPYHHPGFQAQLEAYHADVVRAHAAHAPVTAPMPVLPPYHGPGSRGATWVLVPDPPAGAPPPPPGPPAAPAPRAYPSAPPPGAWPGYDEWARAAGDPPPGSGRGAPEAAGDDDAGRPPPAGG